MLRQSIPCFISVGILCLSFLIGCGKPVDPQILAARKWCLLKESPGEAIKIAEARDLTEQDEEFIIAGKVGVKDLNQWWVDDYATFWITEAGEAAAADHGGADHDPANCPFCRRKWKKTVGVIQCIDEKGELIPIDAKKIFNLKEGDFVTIKGRGSIDESGILNVKSSGIFIP